MHLLEQQRNVVDALRDDVGYLLHAQSLAQSGIYLQIWANRQLDIPTNVYSRTTDLLKPNAAPQPRPEAAAQRRLEGVGCRRLFGKALASCEPAHGLPYNAYWITSS